MKLIETIKEKAKGLPAKRIIIIGLLVLMIIATVAITAFVASLGKPSANAHQGKPDSDSTSVFNPGVSTETDVSQDADEPDEPITYTDERGLVFISNGDGTCYVDGYGSCTDRELTVPKKSPAGDVVTKISARAFAGSDELLTISIPSGVKTIETGAFRGCSELVSISVSSDNSVYCSLGGVLLSADRSVIVCYPQNRAGASYLIPTDVGAIGAYAFEGARNLKRLFYEENVSQFQRINVLIGNDILDDMSITCNYVSSK